MIRYSSFPQVQQEFRPDFGTLDLYIKDKAILESTLWLNGGIIYAAQSLFRAETNEWMAVDTVLKEWR